MHGKVMPYALVAAGALAVGFLAAGTPVASLLPFVLLLACPLMMVFMMRGMGHDHGGSHSHGPHASEHDHGRPADDTTSKPEASVRG